MGFPGGSDSKESAFNAGDLGSKPGLGRSPGGGHGNPFQCSCPGNPHGQRSLESYSPWGCKESDIGKQQPQPLAGVAQCGSFEILFLESLVGL